MQSRLANLLGAVALAATDRLSEEAAGVVGRGGGHPAALVHLLAHPGGSVEELGRVLRISQPGAVQLANRLEAAGLLERCPGSDARTLALHPTVQGRRAARSVLARRERGLGALLDVLDPDEQRQLLPLLEKVTAGLANDRPGALTACRLCNRDACADRGECPLQHTMPVD